VALCILPEEVGHVIVRVLCACGDIIIIIIIIIIDIFKVA